MEGLLPDLDVIRKDFPILERTLAGGQPLVYLDSANTSQKPQVVIDTMVDHLERHNANIARAMHQLGAESTEAYEGARDKVATFLNAPLAQRGDLHQERHRGAQPARPHDRPRSRRQRRHHRDGAPLQHRVVAAGVRALGRGAALVRPDGRRPARPHATPTSWSTSTPRSSPSPGCPTCSARSTRSSTWWRAPRRSAPSR